MAFDWNHNNRVSLGKCRKSSNVTRFPKANFLFRISIKNGTSFFLSRVQLVYSWFS